MTRNICCGQKMSIIRNSLIGFILIGSIGCHSSNNSEYQLQADESPIQAVLRLDLSDKADIRGWMANKSIRLSNKYAYLTKHKDAATNLTSLYLSNGDMHASLKQLVSQKPASKETYLLIAFLLLDPESQQVLYADLEQESEFDAALVDVAALEAGIDPSLLLPATAAGDLDYRIVPLIRSASVTLFNQSEETENTLFYRQRGEQTWSKANSLLWEPVNGALSGSIVRLRADTEYEIKVQLVQFGQIVNERQLAFQTRPESPPINPDLVFNLSDIYTGGQLDFRALNINGAEDGWAKVIADVPVAAPLTVDNAVHLGNSRYLMLENFVVTGGRLNGIYANQSHHIWIKNCDISEWGRPIGEVRNGIGFESENSGKAINHDAGIFLEASGVVTVEGCTVHAPNGRANHWGKGHPQGPVAMFIDAKHPDDSLQGQYILRNNRFYGTQDKRFNDVIEGRANFWPKGGFVRDSAIYANFLAYANDDLLEIDGGQSNVLVYDNQMTKGYCGISAAPNVLGPSYIFNNAIYDLADERGKQWSAIKMGGIKSRPIGLTNIFENIINTARNGISYATVEGDKTIWVKTRNNLIVTKNAGSSTVGFAVLDKELYPYSSFQNDLVYNIKTNGARTQWLQSQAAAHPYSSDASLASQFKNKKLEATLPVTQEDVIANFSTLTVDAQSIAVNVGILP